MGEEVNRKKQMQDEKEDVSPMKLILHEIRRLEQDYYNCDISFIKELILSDIRLLIKAVYIIEEPI